MVLDTWLVPFKNIRTEEEILCIINAIESLAEIYDLEGIKSETIGQHKRFRILQEYALHKDQLPSHLITIWRAYYNTPELVSRLLRIFKLMHPHEELNITYPHLLDHTDWNGYYVPLSSLKHPFWVNDNPIGSSFYLLGELKRLKLEMSRDGIDKDTVLFFAWKRLFDIVKRSVHHSLIIIFVRKIKIYFLDS